MNSTSRYAIYFGAPAYRMYYTGHETHGYSAWSYDAHKAASYACLEDADREAHRLARWLNACERGIITLAEVAA